MTNTNLKPQKKYIKANKAKLGCSFDKELLEDFKQACKSLGIDQTPLITQLMIDTINREKNKEQESE